MWRLENSALFWSTFKGVGGAGEAAADLQKVIEFLKNLAHFQRLGGKMPKGALLAGPSDSEEG